ncbi:MAG: nitrous oxide-stimulated promoter family protein [Planctomycetes bacterium]|nr:nitrous oxide-stimulated promoter family protein [Planctomycetota bacterium]
MNHSLKTEAKTIAAMMLIYCKKHHSLQSIASCKECSDLLNYANERLKKCPFKDEKPVCSKCEIHCYHKEYKERIRKVMAYSGKRMIWKHPILALKHLFHK